MKLLRFLLGAMAGVVCLILGMTICGDVLSMAASTLIGAYTMQARAIGQGIGSVMGLYAFSIIDKDRIHRCVFCILETLYLLACLFAVFFMDRGDWVLFPTIGVLLHGIALREVNHPEKEHKKKRSGLIDGEKALQAMEKIRMGGTAELSVAQITNMIVNMPDAKQALPKEQFEQVYLLYTCLMTETEKSEMDLGDYMEVATQIVKAFNETAPYELYSGADQQETKQMLDALQKMG